MSFRTRLLLVGLIVAAVVPSFILAALALGLIGMPGSEPAVAVPAPQAAAPSAVLSAPDRIEAIAGEDVSFPIALDGTDGMPPRSVVAIKGLPQGSHFSEGRPYGDSEWNLKPDQIGDLDLVLPADAHGEFKLGVALIAPDNKVVTHAETLLKIAPAPAPATTEQVAAVESNTDGIEATPAALPDPGDGSEPADSPTPMETATAPPGDAPTDTVEPTMEQATAPSGTQPNALGQAQDGENGLGTVQPSMFVNMRESPSSSSPVLGVIAKGAELSVLDRKRGWVQVTDPASGKKGWIYSGLLAGEAKPHYRRKRAAPAPAEQKSESFWSRLGGWLSPSEGN
jgi:Bacterial SH3 domain